MEIVNEIMAFAILGYVGITVFALLIAVLLYFFWEWDKWL